MYAGSELLIFIIFFFLTSLQFFTQVKRADLFKLLSTVMKYCSINVSQASQNNQHRSVKVLMPVPELILKD